MAPLCDRIHSKLRNVCATRELPGYGEGGLIGMLGLSSFPAPLVPYVRHLENGRDGGVSAPAGPQTQTPPAGPLPQTDTAQTDSCRKSVLSAVSDQFDTNFSSNSIVNVFPNGHALNFNLVAGGLPATQFNAIQTGRYPLHWWTYLVGYGPTLHVTNTSYWDPPPAIFQNLNDGGATAVLFTAHIDTAFAYNPIGFLFHFLGDVLHLWGSSDACHMGVHP